MPRGVSVEVKGLGDLERLSRHLREAGDGGQLRRELLRNIRSAVKPAVDAAKADLSGRLPRSGGAAAYFAGTRIGTRTTLSGRSVGVRIVAQKKGNDIVGLDEGVLRHPLFGNRNHWYSQRIPVGLITDPLAHSKPEVQQGVLDAMDEVSNKIARDN